MAQTETVFAEIQKMGRVAAQTEEREVRIQALRLHISILEIWSRRRLTNGPVAICSAFTSIRLRRLEPVRRDKLFWQRSFTIDRSRGSWCYWSSLIQLERILASAATLAIVKIA
ncbi:MAG: hypothetical protein IPI39_19160 [Candidatus Obscuribacter sp.]|nr:hypothetical protein [Candidatus Obscuribacter sp.]